MNIEAKLAPWLYPELRGLAETRREDLLIKARQEPYDTIEWIGLIAAMGIAALALRWLDLRAVFGDSAVLFGLASFAWALVVLYVLAAPWMVRRTRRGLKRTHKRDSHESSS